MEGVTEEKKVTPVPGRGRGSGGEGARNVDPRKTRHTQKPKNGKKKFKNEKDQKNDAKIDFLFILVGNKC